MVVYYEGDFSFITDVPTREILTRDYNVVNSTEGAWEALKNHNPEKPFDDSLKMKLSEQQSIQTIETMECIAKDGWNKYVIMELTKKVYS